MTTAAVPSAVFSLLAALAIFMLSRFEHSRSVKPSFVLNIYLFTSLLFDAVQVRTLYLRQDDPGILGLFTATIGIKTVLLLLEAKDKRSYLRAPYNTFSPESTASIFNRSFFWWLNPILAAGFRRILTLDDLFAIDQELLSESLQKRMQVSWNKCMYLCPFSCVKLKSPDHSSGRFALVYAVFHCLRWPLASIVFPRLCVTAFNFAQPFLISTAINYLSKPATLQNKNDGYGLIAGTGLVYLGIAVCQWDPNYECSLPLADFYYSLQASALSDDHVFPRSSCLAHLREISRSSSRDLR